MEDYLDFLYSSRPQPAAQQPKQIQTTKTVVQQHQGNTNQLQIVQQTKVVCQKHIEIYKGMCTICGHILSKDELLEYRQFALLNHSKVQVHSEFGQQQVNNKRDQFIQERKLVLVLDLDHTLLHSKTVERSQLQIKSRDRQYIALIDEIKSIYEVKMNDIAFHVKLRTFLPYFLKQLRDEGKYEVHYYTAGTRSYGMMILDLLKLEFQRLYQHTNQNILEHMKSSLTYDKLIGRDDKERFEDKMSEQKLQEQYYAMFDNPLAGGDSTLNMKNFFKSLNSLAGGDDSIFVIIDDRFDVWQVETKDQNGNPMKKVCDNLIQIPPYFYWDQQENYQVESYKKLILSVARAYDLDLSLIFHLKFLNRVHKEFYDQIDHQEKADIKPILRKCRKNIFSSDKAALFEILFKDQHLEIKKLERTYEGNKSKQLGLKIKENYDGKTEIKYMQIVPDTINESQANAIKQQKENIHSQNLYFVSIYWLYMSSYYICELDPQVFTNLNTEKIEEMKRVKLLLLELLSVENQDLFKEYSERYRQLQQRRIQQQKHKQQQEQQSKENSQSAQQNQEEKQQNQELIYQENVSRNELKKDIEKLEEECKVDNNLKRQKLDDEQIN